MVPQVELHPHGGGWLYEIVFGLNDGLVTTLVFVMAVAGLAPEQLVRVALGEMMAGGVSMGLGGYLAARTSAQVLARRIATERIEISEEPDEERAELRAIYRRKGLRDPLLGQVVSSLSSNDDRWLKAMVSDELGIVEEEEQTAWRQGLLIGLAFVVGALVPILPFLLTVPWPRGAAFLLTALAVLALGAVKARYTLQGLLRNSAELLGIVVFGTVAGVVIGQLLGTG
jgi:VIT1/CCC1 family predicted Fe2+/Mn2+ transporter